MAGIKKSSLISQLNIDEILDNTLGGIESIIENIFGANEDAYDNQRDFRAVVITNPKTIEPHEYKALGFSGSENKMDIGTFKKFKVRITHKTKNPHAILQDPCDITLAADKCEQNALVALHTTVVAEANLGINIGTFVTVRLQQHSSGLLNLQTAELVEVLHVNETGNTTLSAQTCDSIRAYFKFGEAYSPPPPVEMPSELRSLAELYDETNIPGKNNALIAGFKPHKAFVGGVGSDAVKAPFDIWVKALIYLAREQGFKVQITSGFRDPVYQEKLHQERKAAKARGENVLPAACGLCPTRSRHTYGMAIDLNFYDTDGTLITSSIGGSREANKLLWTNSGFVGIATGPPLFLRWGGTFKNYDPVHFDFNPTDWGTDEQVQEMFERLMNHNVDTVSTGGLTPGEQREQEQMERQQALGMYDSDQAETEETPPAISQAQKEAEKAKEERERKNDAMGDAYGGF